MDIQVIHPSLSSSHPLHLISLPPPLTPPRGPITADHYKHEADAHMDKIQVTTLMIHAHDDPIVPSASIDWDSVVQVGLIY